MKKILFFVLILLLSLSFLIFHDKGNEILKPYLSSYLEHKFQQNISVEIEQLKLDFNYLEFSARVNKIIKVNAEGDLSLFAQKLNLNYTLNTNDIKNKIDINGTVVGAFNNLKIQGKGDIVKSSINYAFDFKNDVPKKIKLHINNADVPSLLQLLSQPTYATTGKIDINMEIPNLIELDNKGEVKIVLHPSTIDQKVYKSDLLTLELSHITYNINTKELLANYLFTAPRLSKLVFLSQKKLNGKLDINGQLELINKDINITGTSESLGGKTNFDYNGKNLNAYFNNIKINKLLYILNEKPYVSGEMDANVKLSNLKQLKGTFELSTQTATTNNHTIRKEFDLNLKKPIPFTLQSKGAIVSNILNIQSLLKSEILTYTSDDSKYHLNTSTLSSSYQVKIPKLSKLDTIMDNSLKGKLELDGKMNYDKGFLITGSTKSFDGNIDFRFEKKQLNSKINNISAQKLMYLFSYPQTFKANVLGTFNYDFATQKGKFLSTLHKTQFLNSDLTSEIKQLRGLDLTKEHYDKAHFNVIFNKNLIDINFKAKNKRVLLAIPFGRINKAKNRIDATFNINIDNKEILGKLQGDSSDPEIRVNSSKFIKDEMQNMFQGNMPDEAFNELGFGKKETDMMRGMMDSFF
ncbi:MAG: Unknown protein [uncultured Sulfurovum sp.]|uniref:Periplasmic protein n=1 Tax=uncultured Sulfurovum sp. TaxID=269237 RepID=A0A6S6T3L4_9BACT|nr:MAG: Unknown protein [uncultured Sulfurovum sp.]